MSLLVYCVAEQSAAVENTRAGVGGMIVECIEHTGLRCFLSRNVALVESAGEPIRDAALAFHRVLEEIFEQAAIIPFRFPTLLSDEPEVIAHLEEHAAEYREALVRLRNMVQMELRIRLTDPEFPLGNASPDSPQSAVKPSGTEYLLKIQNRHANLERVVQKFRQAGASWINGWRQRDSREGIRCFALIRRDAVCDFQSEFEKMPIQPELRARLSGPWPATEFIEDER
jgi:hypothetical protein